MDSSRGPGTNDRATSADLLVVGSGPAGLATAVRARRAGLRVIVLERGHLAENVARFPKQMVFFGPTDTIEIDGLPCDSSRSHPTREEVLSYLSRVARVTGVDVRERTCLSRLEGRNGDFTAHVQTLMEGPAVLRAAKVVLATGVFGQPRRLDVPGADLPIVHYAYSDPFLYRRQKVVVVGAGNGAAEAALRLCAEADAEVTVLNRARGLNPRRWRWRIPDIADLVDRGRVHLVHHARVEVIEPGHVTFSTPAGRQRIASDHVLVQIGYQADTALLDAVGIHYDASGNPSVDPCTLETNVPGVYLAGAAVQPTCDLIFVVGSRNHGRAILAHILDQPFDEIEDRRPDEYHWSQFERFEDELDPDLALDLVPVVVGEFAHQLLDVHLPALTRHRDELTDRGVPLAAQLEHPWRPRATLDELAREHFEVLRDGTIRFKGQRFPPGALAILRLADGRRRIREIAAEVAALDLPDLPADAVVQFLVDLIRAGKLHWRAPGDAAPRAGRAD